MASHADPPLTTIRVPARELGCSAWHLLSAIRDGADVPEAQCVPFELVVRDSTAPPDRRRVREPASPRQAGRGRAKGSVTTEWPASAPKNSSPTIASTSFTPRSRSERTWAWSTTPPRASRLWDTEGKMYLDASSQMVSCNLGHGRREIIEAAQKQLDKLQHVGQYYGHSSTPMVECAMKLATITPGDLDHFWFTSGGGESTDAADPAGAPLLERRWASRTKQKVISLYMSYHGTGNGPMNMTGIPAMQAGYGPAGPGLRAHPGVLLLPLPVRSRVPVVRPALRAPPGDRHRGGGPGERRRVHRRAGAGRLGLPGAAGRVLAADPRDLRRVRRH